MFRRIVLLTQHRIVGALRIVRTGARRVTDILRRSSGLMYGVLGKSVGWMYRARYLLSGLLLFLFVVTVVIPLCATYKLVPPTTSDNFYNIAWTYVTLAVAVVALTYPLALSLRESLTGRLFKAYESLQNGQLNVNDHKLDRETFLSQNYVRIRNFRKQVFDVQLPFFGTFVILSVFRTLLCLLGIGPLPRAYQVFEPQIYAAVLLLWVVVLMISVLVTKPFAAVEDIETLLQGLPPLDEGTFSARLERDPTLAHSWKVRVVVVLMLLALVRLVSWLSTLETSP